MNRNSEHLAVQKSSKTNPKFIERSEFKDLKNYVFGSSAAIITETSLIVSMGSARASEGAMLGGLLTIALADNISDSLGLQLYNESDGERKNQSLLATILNFLTRLFISLSFVAIVLIFPISQAMVIGTIWGLLLLTVISYLISKSQNENNTRTITRLLVAVFVILMSRVVGSLIAQHFS